MNSSYTSVSSFSRYSSRQTKPCNVGDCLRAHPMQWTTCRFSCSRINNMLNTSSWNGEKRKHYCTRSEIVGTFVRVTISSLVFICLFLLLTQIPHTVTLVLNMTKYLKLILSLYFVITYNDRFGRKKSSRTKNINNIKIRHILRVRHRSCFAAEIAI